MSQQALLRGQKLEPQSVWSFPYSGQIIGVIVDALDLQNGILVERTAKRFYAGHSISEYSKTEVFKALGTALVDLNIVPVPELFAKHDVSVPIIIAATIARAAVKWDRLRAIIQSRSGRISDTRSAAISFLRLAVVDLALRVFALLRLAETPPTEPNVPLWSQENGAGRMLRGLIAKAGLTRDQLAAFTEVSETSVDNWLDGSVRPGPKYIAALADVLSSRMQNLSPESLGVDIQRQFALAELANVLAMQIGRDAVTELATALCRFVWLISRDVDAMSRPPISEAAGEELVALRYGTDHRSTHALLRNLALVETDDSWTTDILASTTDWSLRFQEIVNKSGLLGLAAGLSQDIHELKPLISSEERNGNVDVWDEADEDIKALQVAASKALEAKYWSTGDLGALVVQLESGLSDRRLIVRRHPLSSQAHFELGSFLGMAGKWFRKRDMIDEAVAECKIAAELRPEWDGPLVEVGIILGNAGYYEEALAELETAVIRLPKMTPHLAFNLGFVNMSLGESQRALHEFETVINVEPKYAIALVNAAHCAFVLGERAKGIRYAKRARLLGEPRTYVAWRNGAYTRRR